MPLQMESTSTVSVLCHHTAFCTRSTWLLQRCALSTGRWPSNVRWVAHRPTRRLIYTSEIVCCSLARTFSISGKGFPRDLDLSFLLSLNIEIFSKPPCSVLLLHSDVYVCFQATDVTYEYVLQAFGILGNGIYGLDGVATVQSSP